MIQHVTSLHTKRKIIRFKSMEEYKKSKFGVVDYEIRQWIKSDKPAIFVKVESLWVKDALYTVEVDVGYGGLRLLRNGRVKDSDKNFCQHGDVVALDKDYYGLKKYIWT